MISVFFSEPSRRRITHKNREPDLVFGGIDHGANLESDALSVHLGINELPVILRSKSVLRVEFNTAILFAPQTVVSPDSGPGVNVKDTGHGQMSGWGTAPNAGYRLARRRPWRERSKDGRSENVGTAYRRRREGPGWDRQPVNASLVLALSRRDSGPRRQPCWDQPRHHSSGRKR